MGTLQWKRAFEYSIWKYRRHIKKMETGIERGMHRKRKMNINPMKVVILGLSKAINENKEIKKRIGKRIR